MISNNSKNSNFNSTDGDNFNNNVSIASSFEAYQQQQTAAKMTTDSNNQHQTLTTTNNSSKQQPTATSDNKQATNYKQLLITSATYANSSKRHTAKNDKH